MKILLLEPFFAGSHQQWAEGYACHSSHEVHILSLPGRHWKWRMHGGAVSLAQQFLDSDIKPDLILATDMLDLSLFLSLTRKRTAGIPTAIYFHENQFAYPWSPGDADPQLQRDHHYQFINYTSALAADAVFFNSAYNQNSFLEGVNALLEKLPDFQEKQNVKLLSTKSNLLPLGLDLREKDRQFGREENEIPVILWNHRWEHDKGPDAFFEGLGRLKEMGLQFRLVVLGEHFSKVPDCFERARKTFEAEILHWGYASSRKDYLDWMHRSDFLPVTGNQDFFGVSVVEAMYCGVRPLLPNRLAYPEHVPAEFRDSVMYEGNEWVDRLAEWMRQKDHALPIKDWVEKYDWTVMAPRYDQVFAGLVGMNH